MRGHIGYHILSELIFVYDIVGFVVIGVVAINLTQPIQTWEEGIAR